MKKIDSGTIEMMREYLSYDPFSGVLIWAKDAGHPSRVKRGDVCGSITPRCGDRRSHSKYLVMSFFGTRYLVHRVIWAMISGREPREYIDHINGDGTDNRICNLRAANLCQNAQNRTSKNSSYKGVSWRKDSCKWQARISFNGMRVSLGFFDNRDAARDAYLAAARSVHGEFLRV